MELYILDSTFRRTTVIDDFVSMIWTERYAAWGDFELVVFSTIDNRRLLSAGLRLAMSHSYRVMTIEIVEDSTDSEGRSTLKVTGRSLEAMLEDRVARATFQNLTQLPKWPMYGKPADLMRSIFNLICRRNTMIDEDNIPFITDGTIFPVPTIPEPDDEITVELEIISVYKALQDIGNTFNLGFRLVRNFDKSELYFDVYTGDDRTTLQSINAPVVFSPELDNLTNVRHLTSISNYKNVCYVFHKNGALVVMADGVSPNTEGFERRVMSLTVTDIDMEMGPELNAILAQRGREELAKNRSVSAFDAELPINNTYVYERDYRLGDIVEMRTADGLTNQMRVVEQIFVSDAEGERSYPTLAIDLFITPGSWFAWDYSQTWATADGYWADQP